MRTKEIIRIINLSGAYNVLPSVIIGLDDEYTAYCFNEACFYIKEMLTERDESGELVNWPVWLEDEPKSNGSVTEWLQGHKY